jgi:hypothetical protein
MRARRAEVRPSDTKPLPSRTTLPVRSARLAIVAGIGLDYTASHAWHSRDGRADTMPIEFNCANCGRRLRVGDDAGGRQAKCPFCGTVSTVPSVVTAEPPPLPGGSPFAPDAAPSAPPRWPTGPSQPPPGYRDIPTYLAQAILCTLFCCLPFGIVAIVYAAQVNGKLAMGDYYGAQSASASART